jgi:hypothetical protein
MNLKQKLILEGQVIAAASILREVMMEVSMDAPELATVALRACEANRKLMRALGEYDTYQTIMDETIGDGDFDTYDDDPIVDFSKGKRGSVVKRGSACPRCGRDPEDCESADNCYYGWADGRNLPPGDIYGDCIPQCVNCFEQVCFCDDPKWSVCYADIEKAKKERDEEFEEALKD